MNITRNAIDVRVYNCLPANWNGSTSANRADVFQNYFFSVPT